MNINRRDLLLLGPALAVFPTVAFATIPPPPSSPWYLIFIADGIYRISNLYTVTLPASAGTCLNYDSAKVSQAFGANFTYTQRTGLSAWHMLTGSPSYQWYEYLDKRNGRIIRIWKGDRIEARFADGSRVKVVFRGPSAVIRFEPLVGSERLPDGTRLYRGDHEAREKGRGDSSLLPTQVTPGISTFAWHYSTQDMPW